VGERRLPPSASHNRASILEHGLDWRRMGAAPGIAGSRQPEADGVFLAEAADIAFFFGFARPLDVWAVDVTGLELEDSPEGWPIRRRPIPRERLRLLVAGDAALAWSNEPDADDAAADRRLRDLVVALAEARPDLAHRLEQLDIASRGLTAPAGGDEPTGAWVDEVRRPTAP
jgi:hypothetical protein